MRAQRKFAALTMSLALALSTAALAQEDPALKTRPRKRLIAAYANDAHTVAAVSRAVELGIVEGTRDIDLHVHRDFRVQADAHIVKANGLDRLVEHN